MPKANFTLIKEPPWNKIFQEGFVLTKRWLNVLKLLLIQLLSSLFKIQQKPRDRVKV